MIVVLKKLFSSIFFVITAGTMVFCLYSLPLYATLSRPPLVLQFVQQLNLSSPTNEQQLLGISSIRYIPSDQAIAGRLVLLSDDTGAVENSYERRNQPHFFEFDMDCSEPVDKPCHYSSGISRKAISYPKAWLEGGFDDERAEDNAFWCSLFSVGAYISTSLPVCQTDIEGLELLANGQRLVMEEQVVGAKHSSPSVLRLNKNHQVIHKYSFPFNTFGFKRRFSNSNTLKTGVQPNGGFEGIAAMWNEPDQYAAISEFPLQQDNNSNRFIVFTLTETDEAGAGSVRVQEQYLYHVDPVLPDKSGQIKKGYPKTGVSDILAIEGQQRQFITIERTAIRYQDRHDITSVIKLFFVVLPNKCQKPCSPDSLSQGLSKQEIPIDKAVMDGFNVEGATWGPELSTGERTLVLVNDNDARQAKQPTHLFVFKVIQGNSF